MPRVLCFLFMLFVNLATTLADESRFASRDLAIANASEVLIDEGLTFQGRETGLKVFIDPTFSQTEKDLIKNAVSVAKNRTQEFRIFRIAWESSNAEFLHGTLKQDVLLGLNPTRYGPETINHRWGVQGKRFVQTLFGSIARRTVIHITRITGSRAAGLDWVGFPPVRGINPGNRITDPYSIALNAEVMTDRYAQGTNPDYWAGVIVHELLHNEGLTHPDQFPHSFINEYGRTVGSNGQGALALTMQGKLSMPRLCPGASSTP